MKWLVLLLAALAVRSALADDRSDSDALTLLGRGPIQAASVPQRDWRAYLEGAWNISTRPHHAGHLNGKRLSFDFAMNRRLGAGWNVVFANRFDWSKAVEKKNSVNTFKEAYLGYQPGGKAWSLEAGRINTRFGVALGYNPTDFFRMGTLRSVVSVDPVSLRDNRLGVVMLRGQYLWPKTSLTGIWAPEIGNGPSSATFSPDFGASNAHQRWLVAVSHAWSENFNPQFIVTGSEGRTHLGLNFSTLINNATVAYMEWAGGREPSLLDQAAKFTRNNQFRSRLAAGVTHTLANKLTISAEIEYNGAAADRATWNVLRNGTLQSRYGAYRNHAGTAQEPLTRRAMMLYLTWPDITHRRLDLTTLMRHDLVDHSRMMWAELRYHWQSADLSLQLQLNSGGANTSLGSATTNKTLQLMLTHYFR
jgi:hypothetical protein